MQELVMYVQFFVPGPYMPSTAVSLWEGGIISGYAIYANIF